jgi:multisubunit Na+/H+ antiporter MnhE subunit
MTYFTFMAGALCGAVFCWLFPRLLPDILWDQQLFRLVQQLRYNAFAEGLEAAHKVVARTAAPIKGTPYSCGPRTFCSALETVENPYEDQP